MLERLERIDALRREGAPVADVLAEVRSLLAEGERWISAERPGSVERARTALADCRAGLVAQSEEVATETSL